MSRRTKLLEQLLQTDTFGDDAKDQQDKMRIVSELILCDMVDIALNGVQQHGAGSLFINLIVSLSICQATTLKLTSLLLNPMRIRK